MFTRIVLVGLRVLLAREDGDTMSQVAWSVGFIILVGVIAVVVGPAIGANWREFVGKPTP
jgi:ABC-type lipoprotein release transport system permease subunit